MKLRDRVNKTLSYFIENGWLTKKGNDILAIGCLLLTCIPLWLVYKNLLSAKIGLLFIFFGILLGSVVGYTGQAKQSGFQPPFTNDPLGWRKAKQSYKVQDDSDESIKEDIHL